MSTFEAMQRVIDCARATLTEQRREFQRGELTDLDELEDALQALPTPQPEAAIVTDEETERALAARLAATEAASRLAEHGFQDIAHTILNALSLLDAAVRRLAGLRKA